MIYTVDGHVLLTAGDNLKIKKSENLCLRLGFFLRKIVLYSKKKGQRGRFVRSAAAIRGKSAGAVFKVPVIFCRIVP